MKLLLRFERSGMPTVLATVDSVQFEDGRVYMHVVGQDGMSLYLDLEEEYLTSVELLREGSCTL